MDRQAIKALQELLVEAGHGPLTVDGLYGPRTAGAVSAYHGRKGQTAAAVLDDRSEKNLQGVHVDLQRIVRRARSNGAPSFTVIEGLRTKERQAELVKQGASQTLNSRHLTGHAVDVVPLDASGKISWAWPLYYPLAAAIKQAAKELGVPVVWGGDWKSFKDGPHWELDRKYYPA